MQTSIFEQSWLLLWYLSNRKHVFISRWGCKHESLARKLYEEIQKTKHIDFAVADAGLKISNERCYFGATADGLTSCSCCGKGCIEIKCPSCINLKKEIEVSSKKVCLETVSGGQTTLKKDHAFYYQIQAQMYCLHVEHGDFVLWQPNQIFIQRIAIDIHLLNVELPKVDKLF